MSINQKFRHVVAKLSKSELGSLKESIQKEGCRDALILWGDILVDGHNRYDICQDLGVSYRTTQIQFEDDLQARIWIRNNQFARRNLTDIARIQLALDQEEDLAKQAKARMLNGKKADPPDICPEGSKGEVREQLAKMAGVSDRLIREGRFVLKHVDKKAIDALRENQTTIHRVFRETKSELSKENRDGARKAASAGVKIDSNILVGDFRKLSDQIPDGSISLIFTDPPYDRKASAMLPALAEIASRKLCDGGSFICYVGHTQLPAALDAFRSHLRYWWTICCLHSGGDTLMSEYGIKAAWKPVLWFVKGTRHDPDHLVRDVMSGGREKSDHDWQQAESEAAYWIEALCPKDGIVWDPFLGSGTTAAAAKKLNRNWIGCEIDKDTAKIASKRIGQ